MHETRLMVVSHERVPIPRWGASVAGTGCGKPATANAAWQGATQGASVAAILFSACFSLTGCALPKPPAVVVGVPGVAAERSDEALRFVIPVEFTNPNDEELELREFRYTVTVNGRATYVGRRAAQATVPGNGSNRAELPVVVPLEQLASSVGEPDGSGAPGASGASRASRASGGGGGMAYTINGSLTYITPGQIAEILFDTGVRKPKVGFTGQGQVATQ